MPSPPIIELDSAIPRPYQNLVESELSSPQMLWTYQEESASTASAFARSYGGFSHMAYLADDQEPSASPLSSLLLPILFVFCEKAEQAQKAIGQPGPGLHGHPRFLPPQAAAQQVDKRR